MIFPDNINYLIFFLIHKNAHLLYLHGYIAEQVLWRSFPTNRFDPG